MSRICLIGGSGFVGCNVAEILVRQGHTVIVPTRNRERAKRNLILLPTVDVVAADVYDDTSLDRLMAGCDAVINFVGVLHSRSGSPLGRDFVRAHIELPYRLINACGRVGIRRIIHVSALGAAPGAPSQYLRSKAEGEARVLSSDRDVTVFKPSIVFGPDDGFLNLFARLQKFVPVMVLAMPDARLQPVYVEDVARAIVASIADDESYGKVFPLAGPKVYTLRQLVRYAGEQSGNARPIIGLPPALSKLQGAVMGLLPIKLMTLDNVRSLSVDNVSATGFPFGIEPTALESIAPGYLRGMWPRSRFDRYRHRAGRHS